MISRLWAIDRVTISNNTITGVVGSSDCSEGKHSPEMFPVVHPAQGAPLLCMLAHKQGVNMHTSGEPCEWCRIGGYSLQWHFPRWQGHRAHHGCTCPWRAAGEVQETHMLLASSAGTVSRHEPHGRSGHWKEEQGRQRHCQGLPLARCPSAHGLANPYRGRGRLLSLFRQWGQII